MNTIDSNKENEYIQEIFKARLIKSERIACPNCGSPAQECFKPSEYNKVWRCKSCFMTLAPLAGTIFEQTQLPIELWLHIIRLILESGSDIQAKLLHYELGVSMPTAYRSINRVKSWQAENCIHKSRRKRKLNPTYRTSLPLIKEMVLKTMPPLFNKNTNSINLKNK